MHGTRKKEARTQGSRSDIPRELYFRVVNGPELDGVPALCRFLPMMQDAQFAHHVNPHKHDFARWVRDAFGDHALAAAMAQCMTRESLSQLLGGRRDAVAMEVRRDESAHPAVHQPMAAQSPATPRAVENPPPVAPSSAKTGASPPQSVVDMRDEEQFYALKSQITARNEALSEKYDEVARQLKAALCDTLPPELEQRAQQLKESYGKLYAKISEMRKEGKEMVLASLTLRRFPSKLQLAQATRSSQDFDTAAAILVDAATEIEMVSRTAQLDVRKEVELLAKEGKENGEHMLINPQKEREHRGA